MKITVQRVGYMPNDLKPGILYVSEEFDIALHLCACDCRAKMKTLLWPTERSVTETRKGVTTRPSVGNWQQPCQSHYWIEYGKIIWAQKWTPEEITAGRRNEEPRRPIYYAALYRNRPSIARRFWRWVENCFKK